MRNFCFILCVIFLNVSQAQIDTATYSKIRINLEGKNIETLAALGLEVDHGVIVKGRYLINDYSTLEIAKINAANFSYDILIPDVKSWYKNQNRVCNHAHQNTKSSQDCFSDAQTGVPTFVTPQNYTYGSMGGYLTYAEMLEVLDSMVSKFPNLISPRTAIGNPVYSTWMGNPIEWLKISDNPTVDETNEPEVLFTSLHHAREPNSLSQNIFFMWYLLENYATDSEIKYLVDNTEIYFIPCINPDGYILNGQNDPNGGGMIRKNGRDNNSDGVYTAAADGVDLNRNYSFEWGYDDIGSSPNPTSQTYRGPSAASEPETQAVNYFCNQHQIEITLNYHTYGNLLIHPWGYTDVNTAEHATFSVFGEEMTQYNNYTFGTGSQTVGYTVNGDSDDWMYGETTTKGKIYSMTPEAGNQNVGFWPAQSDIDKYNKANMHQNVSVLRLVQNYAELEEQTSSKNIYNYSGNLKFLCLKKGLKSGNITIDFSSLNSNLNLNFTPQTFNLAHLDSQIINLPYSINSSAQNQDEMKFIASIDNGVHIYYDTISKMFLKENFSNAFSDMGNTLDNWLSSGWSITNSDYVSSPNSITESPNGNYTANQNRRITLKQAIDLSNCTNARISFWAKWDIENDYDYAQVLISTDGGTNFEPLCGKYTNEGTENQDEGMPVYDGVQATWIKEEIDISEYVGQEVYLQFYFESDLFEHRDGFYFDDFSLDFIASDNTSINSLEAFDFSIYPNPLTNELHLHLESLNDPFKLEILNAIGQEIQQFNVDKNTNHYIKDISGLKKGIYFLRLKLADQQKVIKFIKL